MSQSDRRDRAGRKSESDCPGIRPQNGCAAQAARYVLRDRRQMLCAGGAGATEVLNLSSVRRDGGAKPFPLWGLAVIGGVLRVAGR